MDTAHIAELLVPFLGEDRLSERQLEQVSTYLQRLLRWNQRMNLTAVRDPGQIVTRHFGESFFAGRQVLGREALPSASAIDVGSGAGFPGLPMKIFAPTVKMRLIEAQHRKATFLREVVRELGLQDCEVLPQRVEEAVKGRSCVAELVTLRAVEHFRQILPAASDLTFKRGRLMLLIGKDQVAVAQGLLPKFLWSTAVPIPQSSARVVLVGAMPDSR